MDKSDKSDKFVDPPSDSIIGPASDDQVEQSDTFSSTALDHSETLKKLNDLFASGFTRPC